MIPRQHQCADRFSALLLSALLVLLVSVFLTGPAQAAEDLIEFRESKYNNIYVHKRGSLYSMSFGHNRRFYTESIYDSTDELALPVTYTRYMTAVLAYNPAPANLLEIGFGGGRTAWYLHKSLPGLNITSVELDRGVFELAHKYFGIKKAPNFTVAVADGRRYLTKSDTAWDIIVIDAYRGPFVPFHLLTREFYELVKQKLGPNGVLAQNIEPTTMVFEAALVTVGQVFKNIDLYRAGGNVVMVAYDGAPRPQAALLATAKELSDKYGLKYRLDDLVLKRRTVKSLPDTAVLTDDFAPVESLLAIERHNRKLDEFSTRQSQ